MSTATPPPSLDPDLLAVLVTVTPTEARAAANVLRRIADLPTPDAASRLARRHLLHWAEHLDAAC